MQDDLRQPLKRLTPRERVAGLMPSRFQAVAGLLVVGFSLFAVWLYRHDVPLAGEPVVSVKMGPLEKITTASTPQKRPDEDVDKGPDKSDVPPEPPDLPEIGDRGGRNKVAIIQRPGRLTATALRRAPVKSVSEHGRYGLLPKIARNGTRPFDVYSTKKNRALLRSGKPRIAIVLGGMGINAKLTRQAIRELPGYVTLAFAPYGRGLQSTINAARARGHEVVLHIPMEPYGYPGINPGPKTLLASSEPRKNIENLEWLLSRFSGYSGVTNYMGAKFVSDGGALLPVFSQLKKRGLVYFDDSTTSGTLTKSIASAVQLPSLQADAVIDQDQNFSAIQRALSDLEAVARRKGLAVGTGTGLVTTIDAVEAWSRDLGDRGFMLVPLSVGYLGTKS